MHIIMSDRFREGFIEQLEKISKRIGKNNIELLKNQRISKTDKLGYPREPKGKNVVVIS